MGKSQNQKLGKWNKTQHERFMKALQKYGKNWGLIQKVVVTRTLAQVRSHAQKLFLSMTKQQLRSFQDQLNCRFESFCNLQKNSQTNFTKKCSNKTSSSENTLPRPSESLHSIQDEKEKYIWRQQNKNKEGKVDILSKQNSEGNNSGNLLNQNQVSNKEKNQMGEFTIGDQLENQSVQNIPTYCSIQTPQIGFYILPTPTIVWFSY